MIIRTSVLLRGLARRICHPVPAGWLASSWVMRMEQSKLFWIAMMAMGATAMVGLVLVTLFFCQ